MIVFFVIATVGFEAEYSTAQQPLGGAKQTKQDAQLEDALFLCLSQKLKVRPGQLRSAGDHTQAFDLTTGRSFFYDKDKKAWRDEKTGEFICPTKLSDPALEDALFLCLAQKLKIRPGELRSSMDHTQAYDLKSGRSFFWDKDKKAWRDAKTGECICPKCAPETTTPPPPKGNCLKAKYPHVEFILGGEVAMDRDS